jgi:hypothetical protein
LQGYGGEDPSAEWLKRYVGVTAIVAAIRMRGSVPPDGRFVRQMRVREGIADEGTGFLRDKQTLVLGLVEIHRELMSAAARRIMDVKL